jgi:hypothetical protein
MFYTRQKINGNTNIKEIYVVGLGVVLLERF